MPKRLIVSFDGTWNTPGDDSDESKQIETNVRRLHEALQEQGRDGLSQEAWYDQGVGTDWHQHLSGGTVGRGLSKNIQQGYAWLVDRYADGDEIFLFGFSRGAYTARSLGGLLRKCGLLRAEHAGRGEEAYKLYRRRDATADAPAAVSFRAAHSREVRIRFLGVWDTVGALGVPTGLSRTIPLLGQLNENWKFHDTTLSRITDFAYHALALDEHREDYDATLWTSAPGPGQVVEQRWFPGAHADVGGGNPQRGLSDLALDWMLRKAEDCGLGVDRARALRAGDPLEAAHDSYELFLKGVYARRHPRHLRTVGATPTETVDDSVGVRFKTMAPPYRPENGGLAPFLAKWRA
ncbi:MAG TPA: DUF2235 domain-containing protein [Methylomirabilota bacterium]|nr:DUF2235 domain-containing protein [Methylomirabilota bacterium]